MSDRPAVDIFCTVVDNFGDAGVCWRLARQLVAEHGCAVRLWIDRLDVLRRLVPVGADRALHEGVAVGDWQAAAESEPAPIVIEAFACTLPAAYVSRMAIATRAPAWINLEYLSAEDWVAGCHALASPQANGITKHFFFPGFSAGTGGLLKEQGLDTARDAFVADGAAKTAFWQKFGVMPASGALKISLFAYENAALGELLDAWAASAREIFCAVPEGRIVPQLAEWAGVERLAAGDSIRLGALRAVVLPFVPQSDYDRLLWACDLNFVRGEDSFVRAQWARKPFVWHIYQQDEAAHAPKLEAFLRAYTPGLDTAASEALCGFWKAWDMQEGTASHWPALETSLSRLDAHAGGWAERVAQHGDLASNLLIFSKNLLKWRAL